jgi:predicted ester cyclase
MKYQASSIWSRLAKSQLAGVLGTAGTLRRVGSSHDRPNHENQSEQGNKALVLQMYTEFDKGNLDGFRSSISPDFAAHVMGNQSMDWEGFMAFGGQFRSAFPDGRHVFDQVVVEGEYVVTVGSYHGTHKGDLQGIAPTGRQIDLAVMHLDRVKKGRIVEHRGIGNALDLMSQLGVSVGN